MKVFTNKPSPILLIHLLIIIMLFYGCDDSSSIDYFMYSAGTPQSGFEQSDEIAISPPPFSEGIFPCSDCHADEETNTQRRELVDMHEEISEMFDHDSENRWCLDCHNADDRDSLRLASGKLLSFKESQKLCGQCHGDKYRDWKYGIHGKRTGYWNGKKQYLLCVSCHNPHSPKFKPIKPMPPPVRQEDIN